MSNTKSIRYTDETKTRDIVSLQKPAVSVSVIIFSVNKGILETILVQRVREPFKSFWSIPGDLIYIDESLHDAAKRVLYEKTGMKDVYLQQVGAFGELDRDPRGRVITIACFALVPHKSFHLSDAPDALHASWVAVNKLPQLAFDHKQIISETVQLLKTQIEYSPLAKSLLPKLFRLSDLQSVYEAIRGEKMDKRNFRKKILSLNLLEETREIYREGNHRPARLYRFKK